MPGKASKQQAVQGRRTLEQFRDNYNREFKIHERIRNAIERLGPEGWAYEAELCRSARVGMACLPPIRKRYARLIVEIRHNGRTRRAWAGSPQMAEAMRRML